MPSKYQKPGKSPESWKKASPLQPRQLCFFSVKPSLFITVWTSLTQWPSCYKSWDSLYQAVSVTDFSKAAVPGGYTAGVSSDTEKQTKCVSVFPAHWPLSFSAIYMMHKLSELFCCLQQDLENRSSKIKVAFLPFWLALSCFHISGVGNKIWMRFNIY